MNDLLHILVCDDEPACVKELGILLKQYEKANKDIFEIICHIQSPALHIFQFIFERFDQCIA